MADLAAPPLPSPAGGTPSGPTLKRSLRFRDLTLFYVVTILSVRWIATAAAAGPGTLVVWVLALVGLFLPLAASVLALAARYPEEGGLYVWTREAFGDGTAFLAAWTYWMSNLPYFPAILYFGAGSMLVAFGRHGRALAASPAYYMGFAVLWLVIIMALNVRGIESGKWLNNICSIGGWLPIMILILLAIVVASRYGSATHFTAASLAPHLSLRNAIFWSTIFFAFAGCEAASFMGEEIDNAHRILPRALLTAGSIIAVAYIAGTTAMLIALPSDAVSGVDGFMRGMEQLATHLGIPWLIPIMAVLVTLSAIGGAAGFLSSTSRLPFVAGIDRYLPAAFGSIHPRYRTPWIALIVYGSAGIVTAILGQAGTTVRGAYDVLVSMAVITLFIPYLLLFAAMIRLARRGRLTHYPLPGGATVAIALAVIGFASTALTIVLSTIPAPDDANPPLAVAKVLLSTLAVILTGLAVFAIGRRRKILARI
ncbi:MAG: glutamate:GABA antiporter [Acidobacteriaceae bacterium]|nr:glutamate:GABA antiporter [Acidobacteriaceae bacterium]